MNDDKDDALDRMLDLLHEGRGLDLAAARQMELSVSENPADIDSRIKLLGHYFTKWRSSKPISEARFAHIEWLVHNCPEHAICGSGYITPAGDAGHHAKIKAKWRARINANPNNTTILSNAASFLALNTGDPSDSVLEEQYLLKCTELEPLDMFWSRQLASHYDRKKDAQKSYNENSRIVEIITDADDLFITLTDLPLRALRAGAYEQSLHAAERLLRMSEKFKDDWNYGNAIQSGHTALGLLALKDGDASKAKQHLAQSVIEEPTPQTEIRGPRLELAEKLLEHGETESVLEYLNRCESLCGFDNSKFLAFRKRAVSQSN
ncbi:MAG: hypothetical protein HYX67_11160 [Candidatus Melainabacteria bacterium]|nr:hypothetical protein [Candidatus Melainabacteria bacterium]